MTHSERKYLSAIIARFDRILAKHIERLFGKPRKPDELAFNLMTLSCLLLLAEQQAGEENNFTTPVDRYSRERLLAELKEIGIGSEAGLDEALGAMQQKGYIREDAAGVLCALAPTVATAAQFDRLLPGMPGVNLIAYVAQTLDEVVAGRKDLESALEQFDQTLEIKGVPLSEAPEPDVAGAAGGKAAVGGAHIVRGLSQTRERPASPRGNLISAAAYQRLYPETSSGAAARTSDGGRIISVTGTAGQPEVREVKFGPESSPAKKPQTTVADRGGQDGPPGAAIEGRDETVFRQEKDAARSHEAEFPDEMDESQGGHPVFTGASEKAAESATTGPEQQPQQENPPEQEALETQGAADEAKDSPPAACVAGETGGKPADTPDVIDDADIASRVASFEEDLALQCPLCRRARVTAEKTVSGKIYYRCGHNRCNFISWGKPYHLTCPSCNNPFLIESERNGKMVLKCPRATCRYWRGEQERQQDGSAAVLKGAAAGDASDRKRRVVRRRVVRRKK